jgi:hypothetical protein
LVERQGVEYDRHSGWLNSNGCKLAYGKPYVCYLFFCEEIEKDELYKNSNIKFLIKDFLSIGNRAYGNEHLICVDDIQRITDTKIEIMNLRMMKILGKRESDFLTGNIHKKV